MSTPTPPGSPQKETKKPRQRVEIDDSEIPDVIERLPKPDKTEHDVACAKIEADIKKLHERVNVIGKELDSIKGGRGGYREQIQAVRAVYNDLQQKKNNLVAQRNEITARVKQLQEKKSSTIQQQRNTRQTLKFHTEEDIDREIARLRRQQETSSMALVEEKRIIKEIEALQQSKSVVARFAQEQGQVEKQNDSIKDVRAEQAKKNAEIDVVQAEINEQKVKLEELKALNDAERKSDKSGDLIGERKEVREQLDAKYTEIKALRAAFKEANDKFYHNVRLTRRKRELDRQREEAERRLEYEAKLAEYEKEMAKIHPYQNEMDACDALATYLEKSFAKEMSEEAASTAESAAPVVLDGMKPLQRKQEDFFVGGGGKKKKGKREAKKGKKDVKLALPLARLESFNIIGMVPPSHVSGLKASIDAIKEKKAWFNQQTSRTKSGDAPAEPVAVRSPKKKNKGQFNAGDQSAFPTLGEISSNLPESSSWGPGMAPPAAPLSPVMAPEVEAFAEEEEN